MTRQTANQLNEELRNLVKKFAAEKGMTVDFGRGTYGPNNFNLKVELLEKTADGTTAQQLEFEKYAASYGLKPSDFGKTFTSGRTSYTITGVNLRSSKYPILTTQKNNGKTVAFPAHAAVHFLKVAA